MFKTIHKHIFLFVIVISIVIWVMLHNRNVHELWNDYGIYLSHPGKIFSAEYDVPPEERILQQPSKCFSCEREMINRGLNPAYGNKTKCFSCENVFTNYTDYAKAAKNGGRFVHRP